MNTIRYDFRSDTVTRPSAGMRAAMAEAEVGDDGWGDDPTVNRLEQRVAAMLGKDAAVFVTSGTQANLLALMSHCGRGDAYIAGRRAHCYAFEGGGAAVLGSIQPQPVEHQADGTLALDVIEAAINDDGDPHFARTRLIALENTFGGQVLPVSYMAQVAGLAKRRGLGFHLDGARGFNASVALGLSIGDFAAPFDTVSLCFSKGLGAPVGSTLVGRQDLIDRARRNRKMLGGSLRQAGVLAAAALYALDHNVERLAQDHARARRLAQGLSQFPGLEPEQVDTNIVLVDVDEPIRDRLDRYLAAQGVGIAALYGKQRWVTHLDIDDTAIEGALAAVAAFFDAGAKEASAG